jgi:hypothetical protein
MIGNTPNLTLPKRNLPEYVLNVPLPFWYSLDSGVALPMAALPYNEVTINFCLRDWTELLIRDDFGATNGTARSFQFTDSDVSTYLVTGEPKLGSFECWGTYAIVSNKERSKMGCGERDMLVTQMQEAPNRQFACDGVGDTTEVPLRWAHGMKAIMFGVRNVTVRSQHANYTTGSPYTSDYDTLDCTNGEYFQNPVAGACLLYENAERVCMAADYFTLVSPYFWATSIPEVTGIHLISYAINFNSVNPMGETNYSKLNNVSLVLTASEAACDASEGTQATGTGASWPQRFETVAYGINSNICRVTGGTIGFTFN